MIVLMAMLIMVTYCFIVIGTAHFKFVISLLDLLELRIFNCALSGLLP